jgi:hypothetical protein
MGWFMDQGWAFCIQEKILAFLPGREIARRRGGAPSRLGRLQTDGCVQHDSICLPGGGTDLQDETIRLLTLAAPGPGTLKPGAVSLPDRRRIGLGELQNWPWPEDP